MDTKAYTSIEIYNFALMRVGCSQFISLFTDSSREASIGKLVYQHVLEKVLEDFNWSFATKFETLTEFIPPVTDANSPQWHIDWWGTVGETDVNNAPKTLPDQWGYAYVLPDDCLVTRSILSGQNPTPAGGKVPYRVVDDGNEEYGKIILTTVDDAVLEYTFVPTGYEDASRGPTGDGGLTYTAPDLLGNIVTSADSFTFASTNSVIFAAPADSTTVIYYLPEYADVAATQLFRIKNIGDGVARIQSADSKTIDGQSYIDMMPGDRMLVCKDSTNWQTI